MNRTFEACFCWTLVATCAMASALWLRHRGFGQRRLSPRAAASLGMPIVGLSLVATWWLGLRDPSAASLDLSLQPADAQRASVIPPSQGATVEIGDHLPSFEAQGWLNGVRPSDDELADKVVVVDIWHEW